MIRSYGDLLLRATICVALPVFLCVFAFSQTDNGAIAGQVSIVRGNFPPDRIEVTLQTRGIVVNQVWTDNEGKFIFHDLPGNLYHVTISDERYEPYEEEVKVNPHTNPLNILSIRLSPKSAAPASPPAAAVAGGNPYMVDPAEYEKRFPKKVVKEFKEGAKCQANGKTDDAIRHFQAALKLAPEFYPAHNNLGAVYLAQSNFRAAQAEFEAALHENQSDTQAYLNLGNVFLLTGHYEECLHMVQEGLRKQPNSGFGQFLLGSVYGRLGKSPDAEQALREAIRLDPNLARAHLELVNVYIREKRNQEAISELKFFLKSFPADTFAPQAQHVLTRLENTNPPAPIVH